MADNSHEGWNKLMEGFPWFNCADCFPIPAYSEFMPAPFVGRKPLGEIDRQLFSEESPLSWNITEIEEEYEIKPGIEKAGVQIMDNLIRLGRGIHENHIHGHNDDNLRDNPYWPPELASRAGKLAHERFVTLLPVMLSRTQDDKGRVTWTFFGSGICDPEAAFWKNFLIAQDAKSSEDLFVTFFARILSGAFSEKCTDDLTLFESGFRVLRSEMILPGWADRFVTEGEKLPVNTRYLLTFRPFAALPHVIKESYLSGRLNLIPFPGSLIFWGMPGYKKLGNDLPVSGQIPLLNMVTRNMGINGLRVSQSGWFHEQRPGSTITYNPKLLHEEFHRTHRWQRLHRYQDELNEAGTKVRTVHVLFSTEPDALGLYYKPMARNSHIWDHKFDLLLDGPKAGNKEIMEAEKKILEGGLFGYRFFFPPMRAGMYEIYLHRILAAWLPAGLDAPLVMSDKPCGYIAAYHLKDKTMNNPVELQAVTLKREEYISALNDFQGTSDHFSHQTSLNIINLLEAWRLWNYIPLRESFARSLLNISKDKDLWEWVGELVSHSITPEAGSKMKNFLTSVIDTRESSTLPDALTYSRTANRKFEENWWNDIKYLAHGQFINKDNADVATDETTLAVIRRHKRDLESLGDYLIKRHRKEIENEGMEDAAWCGELPFKWSTDFDFPIFGGWKGNYDNETHERNILVVIPGKNRKEAVVFGDHYDTAYMEDIYDKERGGSGARLSANGADDNYSATSTLLQAAPIFLRMSKEGKLERDIWLIHLTGEEFPSDCMGARNFCRSLVEKNVRLKTGSGKIIDLSETRIAGVFVMDMIGHNRDNDQDVFQISPGSSASSLYLAWQAHLANQIWNKNVKIWNERPERKEKGRGKRVTDLEQIPETAQFLHINGEVRTKLNPASSLYNTDCQIFSDVGAPVVLFMENYDINRTGYHDTRDTLENIDLDYGSALAAIAIETVARTATEPSPGFQE